MKAVLFSVYTERWTERIQCILNGELSEFSVYWTVNWANSVYSERWTERIQCILNGVLREFSVLSEMCNERIQCILNGFDLLYNVKYQL